MMGPKLSYNAVILLSFFVCIYVNPVTSIKCWVCRSDADPQCADPFDNKTIPITDCDKEKGLYHLPGLTATMCRKSRQKIFGAWRYFRTCAYLGERGIHGDERFCLMRTGTYNIFMEYCQCNSKDGCNTASLYLGPNLSMYLMLGAATWASAMWIL